MIEPKHRSKKLFCFGYGYTASWLAAKLRPYDWQVSGTTTDPDKQKTMEAEGINAVLFDDSHPLWDVPTVMEGTTHILLSVPPGGSGDIVFEMHGEELAQLPNLEWVGYLSTTTVYGNHDGRWIDENTPATPTSRRGSVRLRAEEQWLSLLCPEFPVHFFRLSGIYGPGHSAIDAVRAGNSRRVEKPGHAFNRIHVEDIAQTLIASMNAPDPGAVFNLADDEPVPSHEIIKYACERMGMPVPELIPYDQIDMAPIVKSFYTDNKRIKNDKIKTVLGVTLAYPNYKVGLDACLEAEEEMAGILDHVPA